MLFHFQNFQHFFRKLYARLQLRSALYAPSPAEERRGIGLRNLYMRLRLLYDETAQLTLDSEEGIGTVVQIVIPMERRCGL